jgi:hypothetical protein
MSDLRRPLKDAAVVVGRLSKAKRESLAEAARGTATALPDTADTWLVEGRSSSARKLVAKLNEVVGDAALVMPVLTDGSGSRLFPTGSLVVAFREKPSRAELGEFAREHGLGRARSNEWSDRQVAFAIRRTDARFLGDVVKTVTVDPRVARVWADTRAKYRRSGA